MTSIKYKYTQPFIEVEEFEYQDPETGETVTKTRERERVPIRVYTRKWKQTSENTHRLWLRVTVTDFGATVYESGVPDNVTAPDWYADKADDVAMWISEIYSGELPAQVIEKSVDATAEVVSMESASDDVHAVIDVTSDTYPVTAALGAATVSFDPNRGGV